MKCPKCGSENIFYNTSYDGKDYYICGNCKTHYSLPTVAVSKTELTTAEMLLWLVENVKAVCIFECDFGHLGIRLELPRNKFKIFTTNDEVKNRDMLIDKAYDWAKKELKERLEVE